MKKLLLFILFPVLIFAQENISKDENGVYTIVKILEIPNASKKDLFNKSVIFFSKKITPTFESIQLKDEDNFRLIAKTFENVKTFKIGETVVYPVWDFIFKDGKCKVSISNISFTHLNRPGQIYTLENMPKSWMGKDKYFLELENVLNNSYKKYVEFMNKNESTDF